MNIKKLLEEQRKNWPKAEWHFLGMDIEDTFPSKHSFNESMWASWISKIESEEKEDEKYLSNRANKLNDYLNSDEVKRNDIDLGEMFADELYESYNISNNIYAALVVSIWSKSEIALKKITSLAKRQLGLSTRLNFDFKSQQDFLNKNLDILVKNLPSFNEVNAIRILNNSYKHAGGRYSPKADKPWEQISKSIEDSWGITKNEEINYTTIPISELLEHAHIFFKELYERVNTEVETRLTTN